MSKFVVKNAVVTVNGVTLSDRVAQVAVEMNADDVDVSTMGTGVHEHLAGLRNDQFTMTFLSDFDASEVDATLFPLVATATSQPEFTVSVTPQTGGASATNPNFSSARCILLTYQPISGTVGARSETQVTFPSNEAISRLTT